MHLPRSEESERAVLAAIMLDPDRVFPLVSSRLRVGDFYAHRHRYIYSAIESLAKAQQPIDTRTLQAELESRKKLEEVGGLAYLTTLDLELPDMTRADAYVDIVKETALLRALVATCGRIAASVQDGGGKVQDLLEEADGAIFELLQSSARGRDRAASLPAETSTLVERLAAGAKPITPGAPTGFAEIDRTTHGMRPGKLWLLAARPSRGKSALALQLSLNAASAGAHVLIFSAEMDLESLAARALSHSSGVELNHIVENRLRALGLQSVQLAEEKTRSLPIYVYDDCPTVEEIALRCSMHRHEHGALDLVVVDYIQLLRASGGMDRRVDQVAHISMGLKALAKRMRVAVLALSQLRRLQDEWARPTLGDLKETSQLEQDADVVLFPWADRERSSTVRDVGELIVAKNRDGARGLVEVVFDKPTQTFRLLAHQQAAEQRAGAAS